MDLHKYFCRIDSQEFQVRYSVLSGFSSLRRTLAKDKTISELTVIAQNDILNWSLAVCEHIYKLLAESDSRMYDESIAAYLYCLERIDLSAAYKVSRRVLHMGGIWWSLWMSRYIVKYVERIQEYSDFSSTEYINTNYKTGDVGAMDNSLRRNALSTKFQTAKQDTVLHSVELAFAS